MNLSHANLLSNLGHAAKTPGGRVPQTLACVAEIEGMKDDATVIVDDNSVP